MPLSVANDLPPSAESLMRQALAEARLAWGHTHPNPAVGALVVHQGRIAARGHTAPAGGPHAEVRALEAFAASGLRPDESTTLVVTLEPCCTHGRTPPCTEAILRSGIRRVIVGATDPNPAHAGHGLVLLREAGLGVVDGVLAEDCADLNLIFNHWIVERRPFLAGKIATTLDGRIATRNGLSQWITGPAARQDVMRWRRYFPAIAVGAGTVMADNPRLTARIDGQPEWCPQRLVFDRRLVTFRGELPKLYTDPFRSNTIVVTDITHPRSRIIELEARTGLKFWQVEERGEDGGMAQFKELCGAAGIVGVYCEGGMQLLSALLLNGQLDYLFAYRSPKFLADAEALVPFRGHEPGSMDEAFSLEQVRHETFGDDQLLRGRVRRPQSAVAWR